MELSFLRKLLLGLAVIGGLLLGGASVFVFGKGGQAFAKTVLLTTDFGSITGLREGSVVQVAGVNIGSVASIDFYEATYPCDPQTEDHGRIGQGRSDDCDPQLFCSPEGECARLERWVSDDESVHAPCTGHADCDADEVCVTKPFRRRNPRVYWAGNDGVCARFARTHNRVRVTMRVAEDKLALIRADSRAKVSSNSMLGDQIIEITRGSGEMLVPGGRVQSLPSFYDDLENLRDRIEVISDKAERGLGAISDIFGELNDERVIAQMKDRIATLNEATSEVAESRGTIGGLFSVDARKDLDEALVTTRDAADKVDDFVRRANQRVSKIDGELQPRIDDARQGMANLRGKLDDVRTPGSENAAAKLIYDESGERVGTLAQDLKTLAGTLADVDAGRGAMGEFVNSDSMWDAILRFFEFTGRSDGLRRVVREAVDQSERGGGG